MTNNLIINAVQEHLAETLKDLLSLASGEGLEVQVSRIVEKLEASRQVPSPPAVAHDFADVPRPLYVTGDHGDTGRRSEPKDRTSGVNGSVSEKRAEFLRRFEVDVSRIKHSASFRSLCGKKQIFPQSQGGTVRNRLTHSLEVADVGLRIARKINRDVDYFKNGNQISLDLVYAAGLLHDIGHPPFGHTGEEALDEAIRFGVKDGKPLGPERVDDPCLAFEGNAQTLRCVLRLESRLSSERGVTDLTMARQTNVLGMNLCHRTILSTIKYARPITSERIKKKDAKNGKNENLKGIYEQDIGGVEECRAACIKDYKGNEQLYSDARTIECSIMDLADDIVYSTYDMEDCFASGLLHPLDLFEDTTARADNILDDINSEMQKNGFNFKLTMRDVNYVLASMFKRSVGLFQYDTDGVHMASTSGASTPEALRPESIDIGRVLTAVSTHQASKTIAAFKELRRNLSEQLIESAINQVTVEVNPRNPELSSVRLSVPKMLEVVVLKSVIYHLIVMSPRLTVFDRRNRRIIYRLFEFFTDNKAALPLDVQYSLGKDEKASLQLRREIADYLAGMTEGELESLYSQTIGGVAQSNLNGDVVR